MALPNQPGGQNLNEGNGPSFHVIVAAFESVHRQGNVFGGEFAE